MNFAMIFVLFLAAFAALAQENQNERRRIDAETRRNDQDYDLGGRRVDNDRRQIEVGRERDRRYENTRRIEAGLGTANAGIGTLGSVIMNRDSNRAQVEINRRTMESWDRRAELEAQIALERERTERIRSQDELDRYRIEAATRAAENAANTGRSTCGQAGSTSVCGTITVPQRAVFTRIPR